METLAYQYACFLFFGLGGLGLSVIALCGLVIAQNPREKGGILFLLTTIFFFPSWLCVILPDAVGWIKLDNIYYLRQISIYLGIIAFFFLVTAWFENRHKKVRGAQISVAISGCIIFIAWLALLPQALTNIILIFGVK